MARKTEAEMIGEALREVGALLALFAPLERLLVRDQPLTPQFTIGLLTSVGLLFGTGTMIERLRKLED
jgi:hypothetical protein